MNLIRLVLTFVVALLFVLLTMPQVIPFLHKLKFGQIEREEGLASHKAKQGTPTMGGLVFIIAAIVAVYLCNIEFLKNPYINLLVFALAGFGFIGFVDDYLIVVQKSNKGLRPLHKYLLQSVFAIGFYMLAARTIPEFSHQITIPFTQLNVDLGWLYPVLVYFMFTAESNAVNLSDGLDGLATGLVMIAIVPYIIFALILKNWSIVIFCAAMIGALAGFMHFNYNPAKIFMGDCGSLALGGVLAALSILTKQELLLILIGLVPLCETLSVIIQVISFKTRGKRVFKMAPIHHHFEMCGWSETKVVLVFWLVEALAAIASVLIGVM
jgi:phospho-N-acetylmuramoyl-pentapeptide-transferase